VITDPHSIAFLLPDLGGGGAQKVMLTLAAHLDRSRFAPHLLIVGGAATQPLPDGVPADHGSAARLISGIPWFVRRLRRLKPAIVVSTLAYTNLALLAAAPLLPRRTRIVVREANMPSATLASLPGWLRRLQPYKRLYPRAARIIAQTQDVADALMEIAPAARASIRILANQVDTAQLRAAAMPPQRDVGTGLRLVGAGRLTDQKGFDRLIEAAPQLPADCRLTIFGEGPNRAALAERITALGLDDRIHLAGYRADLAPHLAGADALVMPSRWEGLPNVALEALALGTPVVATPECGLAEVAGKAGGAIRITPFDNDFISLIGGLVADDSRVERLQPNLLPVEYNIETVVAQFQELLDDCLA
jgi:glycosyltransferase involved in cell wall biosynthesis